MFRKLALALVAPLLVAAGACAQPADEATVLTGDAALAALRTAPDAAAAAGSGRFDMTVSFSSPEGAFELTSTGGYSGDQMMMEMDLGSALAGLAEETGETLPEGFDEPMQIVVDGTTVYLRIPMLQSLTGDDGWLEATPEDLGAAGPLGVGGGTNDPSQLLETLRGVGGDVEDKGPDEVRGVATTRYGVTVDLAKALEQAPAEQREMLEAQLKGLDTSLADVPVDVWIDGDGLARRLVMDLDAVAAPAMGAGGSATMTIEFFDYGEPVTIEIPSPEDTRPFSQVLGGLGGIR
jgi:hypothetical protein